VFADARQQREANSYLWHVHHEEEAIRRELQTYTRKRARAGMSPPIEPTPDAVTTLARLRATSKQETLRAYDRALYPRSLDDLRTVLASQLGTGPLKSPATRTNAQRAASFTHGGLGLEMLAYLPNYLGGALSARDVVERVADQKAPRVLDVVGMLPFAATLRNIKSIARAARAAGKAEGIAGAIRPGLLAGESPAVQEISAKLAGQAGLPGPQATPGQLKNTIVRSTPEELAELQRRRPDLFAHIDRPTFERRLNPKLRDAFTDIARKHAAGGENVGSTTNPRTGEPVTSGYVVSTHKDRELPLRRPPTANDLRVYAARNADLLRQDGKMLGTWYDAEAERHVLDVVDVTPDRARALGVGASAGQKAIFHLDTMTEIAVPTTRTAPSPGTIIRGKAGQSHADILPDDVPWNQLEDGFVTHDGRFVTRNEAAQMVYGDVRPQDQLEAGDLLDPSRPRKRSPIAGPAFRVRPVVPAIAGIASAAEEDEPGATPLVALAAAAGGGKLPKAPSGAARAARVIAQGLSKEDAIARMRAFTAEGVRAQVRPGPNSTFDIVRRGEPTSVKPKAPPRAVGAHGQALESGFQSRLMTVLDRRGFPVPKGGWTPQQWYDALKGQVSTAELDAVLPAREDEFASRYTQQQLLARTQEYSPVTALETEVLQSTGGREITESMVYEVIEALKQADIENMRNDAAGYLQARDTRLNTFLREKLVDRFGPVGGQRVLQRIKDEFLPEPPLGEWTVENLAEYEEQTAGVMERIEQVVRGLRADPAQVAMPFRVEPTSEQLDEIMALIERAGAEEVSAVDELRRAHSLESGGDYDLAYYHEIAEENLREGGYGKVDEGNTQYHSYQRVNQEAPYREILISDSNAPENRSHFSDIAPRLRAHARGEIHVDTYLMIEAQSDAAQRGHLAANDPWNDTERWAQLSVGASLRQAAEEGSAFFAWVTPENRVGQAGLAREAANITYGHAVPLAVRRILQWLGEAGDDVTRGPPNRIRITPELRRKLLEAGPPALGLAGIMTGEEDEDRELLATLSLATTGRPLPGVPRGARAIAATARVLRDVMLADELDLLASPAAQRGLERAAANLDDPEILAQASLAGQSAFGGYQRTTQFLRDTFGDLDARTFAGVMAATSPQSSVSVNLQHALETFETWTAAGRPTDERTVRDMVRGLPRELQMYRHNLRRTLTAEDPVGVALAQSPLSGPKVSSFALNLAGDVARVTLDTWQARLQNMSPRSLAGLKRGGIARPGGDYLGYAAQLRRAANLLGPEWNTANVQETGWGFVKDLVEGGEPGASLARWRGDLERPSRRLNLLDPERMRTAWDVPAQMMTGPSLDALSRLDAAGELRGPAPGRVPTWPTLNAPRPDPRALRYLATRRIEPALRGEYAWALAPLVFGSSFYLGNEQARQNGAGLLR
jgi:hypothetical protein